MSELENRLAANYYTERQNQIYRDYKGDRESGTTGHGDRQRNWADDAALRAEFRKDLEDEFGITAALAAGSVTQEKADKLFNKAWEDGHSSGYREVALHYDELSELVL
jgi:hypothetical protein